MKGCFFIDPLAEEELQQEKFKLNPKEELGMVNSEDALYVGI